MADKFRNNLYVFELSKRKTVYVAAPTWKEARNLAFKAVPEFSGVSMLTEIEGRSIKRSCTERIGIITAEQLCDEMPWWTCRCGNNSFMALDDGTTCRCKQCGREMRIILPPKGDKNV